MIRATLPLALLLAVGTAHADNMLFDHGDTALSAPAEQPTVTEALPAEPQSLRERRDELARQANEEMGMTDMLITVVAPGGLLYAAHKEVKRKEAAAELARIDEELARREQEGGATRLD